MVWGCHTVARRHSPYLLAGVFYPMPLLSNAFSFRKPTQPTPSSPLAITFPSNRTMVPQRRYDHGKKQWDFNQLESISFSVDGRPGINMGDALQKTFTGLDGRDDPVLTDAAGAISCRLLVRLLWSSTRSLELTASQVSRISRQRQVMSGMSAEPALQQRVDHRLED
jgi:hypothetical protein